MTREPIPMVTSRHGVHPDHRLLAAALREATLFVVDKRDRTCAIDRHGQIIAGELTPWDMFVVLAWGGEEDLAVAAMDAVRGRP